METAIAKGLNDKIYDKRKAAALQLETSIREALAHNDTPKVRAILRQLRDFANTKLQPGSSNQAKESANTSRNGGMMGLAGASIALGPRIASYLPTIMPPILDCFNDQDHRLRYFACESMYNVAKVAKGEILPYFNDLFDAMSKLSADPDQAVRNGSELLDRLIKDIVTEQASTYVCVRPTTPDLFDLDDDDRDGKPEKRMTNQTATTAASIASAERKAFSLENFVEILQQRVQVKSAYARQFLINWLITLDTVPELELVSHLDRFLAGLLQFLDTEETPFDVRHAATQVLANLLRDIQEAAEAERLEVEARMALASSQNDVNRHARSDSLSSSRAENTAGADASIRSEQLTDSTSSHGLSSRRQSIESHDRQASIQSNGQLQSSGSPNMVKEQTARPLYDISEEEQQRFEAEKPSEHFANDDAGGVFQTGECDEGAGHWRPGQGVKVEYAKIVYILLQEYAVSPPRKNIDSRQEIQATCLQWLYHLMPIAPHTMVKSAHNLVSIILPALSHDVPVIANTARGANKRLFDIIQRLSSLEAAVSASPSADPGQVSDAASVLHNRRESVANAASLPNMSNVPLPSHFGKARSSLDRPAASSEKPAFDARHELAVTAVDHDPTRASPHASTAMEFDYQVTVNALTLQFLDENEETRVESLRWLSMLHHKAPQKILSMDDGTFPALLKTLSDPSEAVIRADLQLLAQISLTSEDDYFPLFMTNLLSLFSTDRKLLETRGSLIIRQLCLTLNAERIYRTFADLLEKDEDLDFASVMVQNLQLIMITSPELADFRRRLKHLETKDGQILFTQLYRSWSHNAVAAFSLCLLAQAYEHAANLLQTFADLEVSVSLLIQIDKLVQLLESPVFTSLRLQLLEPDRYPHLYKCLYGLLMFLPQSSAFLTLRNRLNAVSPLGFLHVAPRASNHAVQTPTASVPGPPRSTIRKADEVKWQDLLVHFRQIQLKHERARRNQPSDADTSCSVDISATMAVPRGSNSAQGKRRGQSDSPGLTSAGRGGSGKTAQSSRLANGSRPISPPPQPAHIKSARRTAVPVRQRQP